MVKKIEVHTDCRYFRGDVPCAPHKEHGVRCDSCRWHEKTGQRILIIKLGAVGDVLRTTPILRKLREVFPDAVIHWLTHTPVVIPPIVDKVFRWQLSDILTLRASHYDLVINYDKDYDACALASLLSAHDKKGFLLIDGVPAPADAAAEDKFLTGIFDDLSRANVKSYLEELFEICGYTFAGEKYILDNFENRGYEWHLPAARPLVGLNTGCGGRWSSRLWPTNYWKKLTHFLSDGGFGVLLLGGPDEHEKNEAIAAESDALYLGHFPLPQFINLVDQCDLVVTAVTMAMHVAIGLEKKIVLFNNTFNRNEFELYGLGEILEPDFDCDCYYAAECPNNCMQYIYPEAVFKSCQNLLKK